MRKILLQKDDYSWHSMWPIKDKLQAHKIEHDVPVTQPDDYNGEIPCGN